MVNHQCKEGKPDCKNTFAACLCLCQVMPGNTALAKADCKVKSDINGAGKYISSMSGRTAKLHGKGHGCIILIKGWHEVSRAVVQFTILY